MIFSGTFGHAKTIQISKKIHFVLSGWFNPSLVKKIFWRFYKDIYG